MKRSTAFALLTLSTLSLVTSVATLGLVAFGAKKMQTEVEEVKNKTNSTLTKFKTALNELDI